MFENEKNSTEQIIAEYEKEIMELSRFLPYLESKKGVNVMSTYIPSGTNSGRQMGIPTYDSTLLSFVNYFKTSPHIDRNYMYVYSRYSIKGVADEYRMIERARIQDMKIIYGILSRYIILGRTKGVVWKEGVENGIFYEAISKMKELIEFWSLPFEQTDEKKE